MRIFIIIILVLSLTVLFSIQSQKSKCLPVAEQLIQIKIQELKNLGFATLLSKLDTGYEYDDKTIDNVTYEFRYLVKLPNENELDGQVSNIASRMANKDGIIHTIEVSGQVNCIEILPFVGLKTGPKFNILVTDQ